MTINLGAITFDEAELFRQLRFDLKDDWFPDPVNFRDTIDRGVLTEHITSNFENNEGEYSATRRHMFNIPKPNFTLRYGLEVSVADRAVYHGICSYLSRYYDPLIPWYVFSHRRDPHRDDNRYMFRRGTIAWRDFIGTVDRSVDDETVLLTTDLSNYFEHIDLRKLKQVLVDRLPDVEASANEKNVIRSYINMLFDCLAEWAYEPGRGLPQNRDASSFLANLYMICIDDEMARRGYVYFRYMDDIKIICSSRYQARRALKELAISLREIGLSVNSKKTDIIAGIDRPAIAEALDGGSPEVEHLDSIWSTRRRESITRSFPFLRQFSERLLNEGKVDSREFRYCINRLIVLATCVEFAVPAEYFTSVTALILNVLSDYPASCDQFCRYLRAVPLTDAHIDQIVSHLCDHQRNFYTWQSYRLWMLLGQREIRRDDLVEEALRILRLPQDNAARAGATLYLGSVGGQQERTEIAENFGSLSTFLGQRSALVAIQELPFSPHVRHHVQPNVRDDLRGVYRNLRNAPTEYFSPMERVSLTSYVDAERDYA